MVALKAGGIQFVVTRHPFSRSARYCGGPVGRSARYFIDPHLSLKRVRQTHDNESMMQKGDVE